MEEKDNRQTEADEMEKARRSSEENPVLYTRRRILEMGAWAVPVIVALAASKPNRAYAASSHVDHTDNHGDHYAAPIGR